VIRSARRLVVLVSGETKADAVRMALDGSADFGRVPGRLAADGSWILDYAAAGLIKR
jgi:6-phosphogluconolactonase/glucosamine-6-phosphate isomerase/deaminase